jgi:hypothetical protein
MKKKIKKLKKIIEKEKFLYNTIFIIFIYFTFYLIQSIFNLNIFTNFNLYYKCIGAIIGYFFHDIILKDFIISYNFYIQNILKYTLIFLFQNIILKLLLNDYFIFELNNILRINFYIFIYFLLDIITNNMVNDNNKFKSLYFDLVKITIGFIIVESFLKKNITKNDIIYVIIISMSYVIFYFIIDKNIRQYKKKYQRNNLKST